MAEQALSERVEWFERELGRVADGLSDLRVMVTVVEKRMRELELLLADTVDQLREVAAAGTDTPRGLVRAQR